MKDYLDVMQKDNRIKEILVLILLGIISIMLVINILTKEITSGIISGVMIISIILIYFLIKKEGKRKIQNVKKMFKRIRAL